MNKHNDSTPDHVAVPGSRLGRRWIIALTLAAAAGAVVAAGVTGGDGKFGHHGHQGHMGHMAMDPAAIEKHIDKMVEHVAGDGTPEQKARLAAIAKSAVADLRPAHEQLRKGHARAHELLMATVIDRSALEQVRVDQMHQLDIASKRVLAAVEDGADILTPAQRARLGEHLRKSMQ